MGGGQNMKGWRSPVVPTYPCHDAAKSYMSAIPEAEAVLTLSVLYGRTAAILMLARRKQE